MTDIARLDVHVAAVPRPGLIRARIEAALAGRPAGPGPEQAIGHAVAAAVTAVTASGTRGDGLGPGKGAVA
jgi:hypothetical protein